MEISRENLRDQSIESFIKKLPTVLKGFVPEKTARDEKIDKQSSTGAARRGGPGTEPRARACWQDICFIHSIPEQEQGLVVLNDGSFRQYIALDGINVFLFDEQECNLLAEQFEQFINSCESDIQILVKSRNLAVDEYLARYQIHIKTEDEYLQWYANYTDQWFRKMQGISFVPQREFYIVLSYSPPDIYQNKKWNSTRSLAQHQDYLETMDRMMAIACEQLRLCNLKPRVLTRQEVRNLIYSDLNPALSERQPEAPSTYNGLTEVSVLASSAMKVENEYLWLDGKYVSTHYVSKLPHRTWLGWLGGLLSIGVEYTLSIFVHQISQDDIRRQLKRKYHLGKVTTSQLPSADLETFEMTWEAEEAIQKFLRSSDKAFEVSAYISCRADSPGRLVRHMDEVDRVLKNRGAVIDRGQMLQLDAWQSTLPVGVDKLSYTHCIMSPVVGTMWPFFTARCGTPDGVPFGFALASREPVLLNPFFQGAGKDANNMFVVGTTGAGKSFSVSMMILRLLPMGVRFVLIDKTVDKFGAYRFMTEMLGSKLCAYIDLGPNSGYVLNPFDLEQEDMENGMPSHEKISRLLSLLDLMLSPEGSEELDVEEKALLDSLIRKAYRQARETEEKIPTMSDLAAITAEQVDSEDDPEQKARLKRFSRGLSLFTRSGAFGGLLDGHTNFDTEKMFIVFDTREVNEPRLERIAVFMLAEFVRRKAAEYKAQNIRFAAVVDEAATLIRFKAGARLLDELARRSRHFGMMLVCITQQLKDFFRQEAEANSVVKNSHMKLLLRQDASDLAILKDTLRLSDSEVKAIERFSRDHEKRTESQALLIVGALHGTIRLVPSPMDYWVCTSEPIHDIPKRNAMLKELAEKNPDLSRADVCRQSVYLLGLKQKART